MDLCTPRPDRGRWSKTSGKTLTKGSARSKLLDVQTVLFSSIRVRRQVSSMAEGSFALGHPGNSVSICVSMYLRVPGKPVYLREIAFGRFRAQVARVSPSSRNAKSKATAAAS